MVSKRKVAIIIAVVLIIVSFPISLILRELYDLSDTMGVAIPSFFLGIGVGILLVSFLIPGGRKKSDDKGNESTKNATDDLESQSPEISRHDSP